MSCCQITDDGVMIQGGFTGATVTEADVEVCKSVIHVVDGLIAPCEELTPPDFDADAAEAAALANSEEPADPDMSDGR